MAALKDLTSCPMQLTGFCRQPHVVSPPTGKPIGEPIAEPIGEPIGEPI